MRWSCPHCGTRLALADDKIGTSWAFSRCYKCAGHALIRKSDINLIKVDKAPPGELVLLPEGSEEPTGLLSAAATQNYEQMTHSGIIRTPVATQSQTHAPAPDTHVVDKPIVRRSLRQLVRGQQARSMAQAQADFARDRIMEATRTQTQTNTDALNIPPKFVPKIEGRGVSVKAFPAPLPEIPESGQPIRLKYLPVAIGVAAAFAVGSGVYLYIQAKVLWEKARTTATMETLRAATHAKAETRSSNQQIFQPTSSIAASDSLAAVQAAAISAPVRVTVPAAPAALASTPFLFPVPAPAPAQAARAQAPRAPSKTNPIYIKLRVNTAYIHAGPGLAYPVIGSARPEVIYPVTDWSDRWFKIMVTSDQYAWIRNDLVQMISTQQ